MCGRASLTKTQKELEQRFQAEFYQEDIERYNPLPNYNVAPTQMHPVITNLQPDRIQVFKWGLIPFWAKEQNIGSRMINARIETILEKPAFKNSVNKRRCLVPIDGFYEWKKTPTGKIPYRIIRKDNSVIAAAGIWEKWKTPEGEDLYSFSIITQPPNELMKDIHDRMPALLLPDQERLWIDDEISAAEALQVIQPYPVDLMEAYSVSTRVNNVRENDAGLLEPVDFDQSTQGSLFK